MRLTGLVVLAGLVGGVAGAIYIALLHVFQHALGPEHYSNLTHGLIMVAVGIVIAVLVKVIGSPGDVELLVDNIHVLGGAKDRRGLRSLIPVSLLCVGAGGALGPEAPLVQTTGTLGSTVADHFGLAPAERRMLTITGMAAGFTVLFGAPLGAAVFALEILHRRGLEYYEALMPAVIGSLAGYAVYVVITGAGLEPVWTLPTTSAIRAQDLAWALGCGVVGAGVAVAFTYLTKGLRRLLVLTPVWSRTAIGGLALGLLAVTSPYALTFGESQLQHVVTSDLAWRTLLVAAVAKLVASATTLASGWRGGFIIPLFFMGACIGVAVHTGITTSNEAVLVSALMVACNVGVTKTPIGSVLVVTEMGGISLLPTTLIAAVVALALTSEVGLIETQRERRAFAT